MPTSPQAAKMVDQHILQHIRIHLDALPGGTYQQVNLPGIAASVVKRYVEHLLFAGEIEAKIHVCAGRLVVLVKGLSPPGRASLRAAQARGLGVATRPERGSRPNRNRIAARVIGMLENWRQTLN